MVTPAARREAATHLEEVHGVSQRRACEALGVDRSSVRYRSRRSDDGLIRSRLREIAAVRRRFGYRRLHVLLWREGIALNHKKLRRLYAEERLQVRRRGGRSARWALVHRWRCRKGRTSAGRSIFCTTS